MGSSSSKCRGAAAAAATAAATARAWAAAAVPDGAAGRKWAAAAAAAKAGGRKGGNGSYGSSSKGMGRRSYGNITLNRPSSSINVLRTHALSTRPTLPTLFPIAPTAQSLSASLSHALFLRRFEGTLSQSNISA